MNPVILTIWPTLSDRRDIALSDAWSPVAAWRNAAAYIRPAQTDTVWARTLPGSRIGIIDRINSRITRLILTRIAGAYRHPEMMWIRHPIHFRLHNASCPRRLVFSADRRFLTGIRGHFFYREYFEKGWVFAYGLGRVPSCLVFKGKDEPDIIRAVSRIPYGDGSGGR